MTVTDNEIQIGAQGRVVIPSALRKALQLKPGDRLIARCVDQSLVLERRDAVERRLKARFSHIPANVKLADRACLALAMEKKLPVLTADQTRARLKLDLDIQVVR